MVGRGEMLKTFDGKFPVLDFFLWICLSCGVERVSGSVSSQDVPHSIDMRSERIDVGQVANSESRRWEGN